MLQKQDNALIFNMQRFSIHDGPGIRTTVFFKGCTLRCRWCSNPESIKSNREVWAIEIKCIKCGHCLPVCPHSALKHVNQAVKSIDRVRCDLCMNCVRICPAQALEQIGRYTSPDEVIEEVMKDAYFYRASGGGVTFSGGEPALWPAFIREVASRLKAEGVNTAIETSGAVPWENLGTILPFMDLFLYDVKHTDPLKHKDATGSSNQLILDNLRRLAPLARTWMRIPVIPGFNDSDEDIRSVGRLNLEIHAEKISLLPYHSAGQRKYERLDEKYHLLALRPPTEDRLKGMRAILESYGHKVTIGR